MRTLTEKERIKVIALTSWWLNNVDAAIKEAGGILYEDDEGNIKNLNGFTVATKKLLEQVKIKIGEDEF
jgi:hypothetical protein